MLEHVLYLATSDPAALAAVRAVPGLQAAAGAGGLWLRGLPAAELLPLPLRALPAAGRYRLDAEGRLFAEGQATPARLLPPLSWQPATALLPLELPTAALPGQPAPRYHPRLVPSGRAEAGVGLLTTLPAWLAYAETAPAVRLQPLRFAAADDGRVLVLGTPLPPLPGQELWRSAGLLLPAGYDFEAPLLAPLLARQLNPAGLDALLFGADGEWERIEAAHLLPATRGAVRLTAASFAL